MRRILAAAAAAALAAFLSAACTPATTITDVWTAEGFAAKMPKRFVVVGIAPNELKRAQFEDGLAKRLKDGTASRTLIPIAQLNDKAKAQAFFKDKGFDGAVVVRVLSVQRHQETMPQHGAVLTGSAANMWGQFDPTSYQRDANFVLETSTVVLRADAYRVDTGEPLVTAISSSFNPVDMDKLAGELFDGVVAELKKRGAL